MLEKRKDIFFSCLFGSVDKYNILQDVIVLERYLRRRLNYLVSIRIITNLGRKQKKITILKSPFSHKVAQEPFVIKYYFKRVKVFLNFNVGVAAVSLWLLALLRKILRYLGSFIKIKSRFLL